MKYGSPWVAGWGNPENALARLDAVAVGARIRLTVQARSDLPAAWYDVLRCSRHVEFLYLEPGELRTVNIPALPGFSRQPVSVLRCGPYPVPMTRAARWFDSQTSRRATHWWAWAPEVLGSVDSAGATAFSAWNLPGIGYAQTDRVAGSVTRGTVRVELTVSGSVATVELYRGSTLLAAGSGSVGGSVTLAGDLAGSVTVAGGAVSGSEVLKVRWPAAMLIMRGTSNPPATVVATVPNGGGDVSTWTEPGDLAGGTYYYRIAPVSDTGETGAESDTVTIVIAAPPAPPSALAYVSGNASALVLSFVESVTPGVTYNVYLQGPADEVMPETPAAATVGAGTLTLPAVTGYPGTVRVLLRAVLAGVEDKAGAALALELDGSGSYVAPRPNAPSIVACAVTGGRVLTVAGAYPVTDERGTAAGLALFVKAGGSWPSTPDAVASLGADWHGVKTAAPSVTLPANGWSQVRLYARTAGGVLSEGYAEGSVFASDVDPAAVQFDGFAARG